MTGAVDRAAALLARRIGVRVDGSMRCTSFWKNCELEPRSYETPMSSRPVRLTKMIFALIATCGVRMSSSWRRATTCGRFDGTSEMRSLLVAVSAVTAPRTAQLREPVDPPLEAPGPAVGAPSPAAVPAAAPPQSRDRSDSAIFTSDAALA